MRKEYRDLAALGPLPAADALDATQAERYEETLSRLPDDPTAEEALALVNLLPPDDSTEFGLAWTIIHAIERSGDWPVWEALDDGTPWRRELRQRVERAHPIK